MGKLMVVVTEKWVTWQECSHFSLCATTKGNGIQWGFYHASNLVKPCKWISPNKKRPKKNQKLETSELLYKVLWLTLVNTFTGGDPYVLEITGERPLVARFIFTPFNKICPVLERWREVFTVWDLRQWLPRRGVRHTHTAIWAEEQLGTFRWLWLGSSKQWHIVSHSAA